MPTPCPAGATSSPEALGGRSPLSPRGLKPVSAQSTMGLSCSSRDSPGLAEKVFPERPRATWRERRGSVGQAGREQPGCSLGHPRACQGHAARSPPHRTPPAQWQLLDSCTGCAPPDSASRQQMGRRQKRCPWVCSTITVWLGIRSTGCSVPAQMAKGIQRPPRTPPARVTLPCDAATHQSPEGAWPRAFWSSEALRQQQQDLAPWLQLAAVPAKGGLLQTSAHSTPADGQ